MEWAQELGVDGLVVQGWEAGGHRGGPVDTGATQPALLPLVADGRRPHRRCRSWAPAG